MKTYPNVLFSVKQNILIAIIIFITLFGLTLKANAQSVIVGNDLDKINNSLVVQLVEYDFDVIIPKLSSEELNALNEATFNQLVYVVDGAAGFYFYMGAKWEMQNVREVFELIDINLAIQKPAAESLIIVAGEQDSQTLLDYNQHIKNIYQDFTFDTNDNAMAVNIED